MTRRARGARLLLAGSLAAACTQPAPTQATDVARGSSTAPPPSPAAPSAAAELDGADPRRPLPLRPMMALHQKENMRDHLVAVQEIVGALARGDFAGVERSAARIGPSNQMGMTCEHMGLGAPEFTTQALAFHDLAGQLTIAAKATDQAAVLASLDATLQACTGCHATWKQQIVDEPTWQALASAGEGEAASAP